MGDGESMELWRVRLTEGDVRVMTLSRLDDWFQSGRIDEKTLVQEEGESKWRRLGSIAGIDAEPAAAPAPAVHVLDAAPALPSPFTPVAFETKTASADAAFDVDVDMDQLLQNHAKKKKRIWIAAALGTVLLAAGIGIVASSGAAPADVSQAASSAAANIAAPIVAPAPPPPPPAPVVAPVAAADTKPALSADQKKALEAADKSREARTAKGKKAAPARRAPKASDPFRKGGNKYDPLNAKLP